jgi:hypothetical protein
MQDMFTIKPKTNYFKRGSKKGGRIWNFDHETLEAAYEEALAAGDAMGRLSVLHRPNGERFEHIPQVGEVFAFKLAVDVRKEAHVDISTVEEYLGGGQMFTFESCELRDLQTKFDKISSALKRLGATGYVRSDEVVLRSKKEKAA